MTFYNLTQRNKTWAQCLIGVYVSVSMLGQFMFDSKNREQKVTWEGWVALSCSLPAIGQSQPSAVRIDQSQLRKCLLFDPLVKIIEIETKSLKSACCKTPFSTAEPMTTSLITFIGKSSYVLLITSIKFSYKHLYVYAVFMNHNQTRLRVTVGYSRGVRQITFITCISISAIYESVVLSKI